MHRTRLCLALVALCGFTLDWTASAASAAPASEPPATQPAATTQPARVADPKMAYALGLGLGERIRNRMKADNITADTQLILRGMIDGMNDLPALYPDEEMRAAIAHIEMKLRTEQAERMLKADPGFRKLAEANLERGRKFLKELSLLEGFESLPNGVLVKVRKPGNGPVVANARYLQVHVEVSLADGTFVHKTPDDKPVRMAALQILPAVLEAIREMHVGGHWQVAVPAELAFGLAGKPPLFGPNQALLIDVQLVAVEP